MTYSTSYDNTTRIATPIVLLITIASMVTLFFINLESAGIVKYISAGTLFLAILLSIAYAPKSYSIDDGFVFINRMLMPPVKINLADILSVEAVSRQQLKGSIRVFGSGAFLGYYGIFTNKNFGRMRWHATNLNNAVLVKTHSARKYILTPDERDSFIKALQF